MHNYLVSCNKFSVNGKVIEKEQEGDETEHFNWEVQVNFGLQ